MRLFAHFMYASLGAVAIASTPAFAQTTNDVQEPKAALGDIVVTAQKRAENVQSTPLAITAVSGNDILKASQGSLDVVLKNVTGVETQGLAQGTQIYIRGVGSSIDPTFADPAVALMVDGAYNGRTEGVETGAYDIERVEVLRGPQGTLYGRNASGGIVNVLTRDPKAGKLEGYVRGTLGNYNLRRLEAAFNVPLGDSAAFRVAGYREQRDGYVDDGSSDSNSWGVRAKVLLKPAEWLRIVAKVDVYRAKGFGANTVPVPGSAGQLGFPPPFFFSNFNPPVAIPANAGICPGSPFVGCAPNPKFASGFDSSKGWVQASPGNPWSNDREHPAGLIRREAETYALDVQADLGFATLTVLPSYTRSRNDLVSGFLFGSIAPGVGPTYDRSQYTDQDTTTKYKSVETRLTSNGHGPLKYVLGLYYLKSDPGAYQLATTGFTTSGTAYSLANNFLPGETLAGFGQVTYSLTDKFRVTGGLRVSRDKSGQNYTIQLGGGATASNNYAQTQNSTQYKVGLEYDLAKKSLLYAHVSTGFKQGGISATFPPRTFAPEKLVAFEVGSKNRFLDDHIQLNMAAFHYSYKNYQFSVFETASIINSAGVSIGDNTFGVIHNAGPTHINGVEAALEIVPWHNGHVSVSGTWLDAKYGTAVLPNNPFVNQGNFDLKGKQIQNSPDLSVNLGFEQGFDIGPGLLTLGVRSHISTSYYTTPEQYLPGAYQGGFSRTDITARYEANSGWSVSAGVRNLENKAQTTYVFPAYRRFVTAPRTFVASVGYDF